MSFLYTRSKTWRNVVEKTKNGVGAALTFTGVEFWKKNHGKKERREKVMENHNIIRTMETCVSLKNRIIFMGFMFFLR